tara:strand:+ start:515 stop:2407 length:1893 start_codon:yes stop_codon:yes gene_type:complete
MKIIILLLRSVLILSPNKRKLIRFFIDAFLIPIALLFCLILFPEIVKLNLNEKIVLINFSIFIGLTLYLITGQYDSLTRYSGSISFYNLALRNIVLVLLLIILGKIFSLYLLSYRAWLLVYISLTGFTGLTRFILRDLLLFKNVSGSEDKTKVAIYGAGSAGAQLLPSLRLSGKYEILYFLDDEPQLCNSRLNGVKIYSPNILNKNQYQLDQVLLAIPSLTIKRRREIINYLQKYDISVLQIPSIEDITSGKSNIDNLRPITIEDLLGRDSVLPDASLLGPGIKGEVICVTGAGGSIGSELCRQIIRLRPKKLVLIEMSEPSLYLIEQELIKNSSVGIEIISVLGNTTDFNLISKLFKSHKINIVFHAAAYKHVPLVELNPLQGILNNAISTNVVCKAAKYAKLKKLILISTDKAVRPTNILGASKRLAELIVQAFSEEEKLSNNTSNEKTIFTMVRFGNVLGSSGSVVPLFQKQIKNGGPITLTHPDIIRFFMTIPEASQLVIQSSVLAEGGEVFLLDMGEPVKIYDLACQMVRLSGLKVKNNKNQFNSIEIKTTGLRPGEKLYEELLIDSKALKTRHKLIFKANEKSISPSILWDQINLLEIELKKYNTKKALLILQKLVPEWKMKNI